MGQSNRKQISTGNLVLSPDQGLTLVSPWLPDQNKFFRKLYRSDQDFRDRLNSKVLEYCKDPMIIVNADASQAEVRMAASLSGEERLLELYERQAELEEQGIDTSNMNDLDFHMRTASYIWHKPIDEVTKAERKFAKTITFAVLYGAGAFKIAVTSNISIGEATHLLNSFWKSYPKIKQWVNYLVAECVANGYVTAPSGRRKATPTVKDKKDVLRCFVEGKDLISLKGRYGMDVLKQIMREIRQARNFPVQSFTSDVVIHGVWHAMRDCREKGIPVQIHTIVHDSVVASVPFSKLKEFLEILKYCMEKKVRHEFKIVCPLKIDWEAGFDYDKAIKLPSRVEDIDFAKLPEKMFDKFKTMKAETIITSQADSSLYLFNEEYQKAGALTWKEEKEAGFTSKDFAEMFDQYRVRWDLSQNALDSAKNRLRAGVEDVFVKEGNEFVD